MGAATHAARAPWRDVPVLGFALLFPLIMAWVYFVHLDSAEAQSNHAVLIAFSAGKLTMFLLPSVYVAWFEPTYFRPAWPRFRELSIGAAFGLVVGASIVLLYFLWLRHSSLTVQTPELVYRRVQQLGQQGRTGFLVLALFISVIHSLFEEYYWRWFTFGQLCRYVPAVAAIAISSIGFMLHHVVVLYVYLPGQFWSLALPFSLAVAVGGAFWAWLYQASGSLYAPWLSHLLVDAAIMVVGYAMLAPYWQ